MNGQKKKAQLIAENLAAARAAKAQKRNAVLIGILADCMETVILKLTRRIALGYSMTTTIHEGFHSVL